MGSKENTTELLYKEPARKQLGSPTWQPGSHYAAYTQPGSYKAASGPVGSLHASAERPTPNYTLQKQVGGFDHRAGCKQTGETGISYERLALVLRLIG